MSLISNLVGSLRLFNRRRLYKRFQSKPLEVSSNGFLFSGMKAYMNGTWEPGTTAVFEKLLVKVSSFVNVGAHHGYFCCIALKNGVSTVAFEPEKANCAMIRKHTAANGFDNNFRLFEAAVGSKTSEMKFFGGGDTGTLVKSNSDAPLAQINTVDVVKLDDIIKNKDQKLLFLIDVEGFEFNVLEGALSILSSKVKHYFIIELWDPVSSNASEAKNKNFIDVFSLMEKKGYRGWKIDETNGDIVEPEIRGQLLKNSLARSSSFSNYLFSGKTDTHEFR